MDEYLKKELTVHPALDKSPFIRYDGKQAKGCEKEEYIQNPVRENRSPAERRFKVV